METTNKEYMGQVIRELRGKRDLKSEELAQMLVPSKSPGTVTSWERGETEPSSEYILQLCNIFDVEPGVFYMSRKNNGLSGFDAAKINAFSEYYIRMTDSQKTAVLAVASAMVE